MFGLETAELEAGGTGPTAREIAQQPALWREVVRLANRTQIQPRDRVVLTGAGSSAFAGEIVAPAIAQRTRARVEAVPTTDIVATPRESELPDAEAALVHAIAAQALALRASLDRGLTPDDPFPEGEVNRVVQGVTIHAF